MNSDAALATAAGVVFLAACIAVGAYVCAAYVLWRIGRKFGVGTFGEYCLPVYNVILMCRWIGVSGWVSLWFFVPWMLAVAFRPLTPPSSESSAVAVTLWLLAVLAVLVYAAFQVYFWGSVATRLGKSFWLYGITTLCLPVVPILFLAFDDSISTSSVSDFVPPMAAAPRLSAAAPPAANCVSLYCVAGELAQTKLAVPHKGLYIGRNPAKANLVLTSKQISNVHARLWPDRHEPGVWLEDWNSLNGTYYRTDGNGLRAKWKVLHGRILLSDGARFRLGAKVAEFEVRGS